MPSMANKRRSDRVEAAFPIRVRGMSTQNKFFEEPTTTVLISKHGLMARIRNLVDLEIEVHITSLKNNIGGTFRVAWVNTRLTDGLHDVGLELIDSDGEMWGIHFPPADPNATEPDAEAWLECQRCHQKSRTPIPEADYEYLRVGFLIARPCEKCKGTMPWEFIPEEIAAAEAEAAAAAETEKKSGKDVRSKGRAPLKIKVKVTRRKFGAQLEDVCQTINVSRTGVLFRSLQSYESGEDVDVILPYDEGGMAIRTPAQVVRQDREEGSHYNAVALQIVKRA